MRKKPEAILFDMGGVLLESADMWTEAGFEKSYPNGLPACFSKDWFMDMSQDIMRRYAALSEPRPAMDLRPCIAEWLPKAGVDPSPESIQHCYDYLGWWEVRPLFPFVHEALTKCNAMGYRIGLISNTLLTSAYHRALFRDEGIYDLFEFMVFSAEFGWNKPDPQIFQHALDAMKLKPQNAWYVGDKPHRDICGAHGVGMTAVLVDGPYEHRVNDSPAHVPDIRIRDISELPELLASEFAG